MYLPFLYAETHYHLKFLYPLYYKKEPEIITDIPTRVIKSISKKIPILLLIKDADKFPVFVEKLEITVLQKNKTTKQYIEFEDFARVELKAGKVLKAQRVPETDKLLQVLVDLGEDTPRQIVAGLAEFYEPDELIGQQVVVVANLKPRKLRGIKSQGMILAVQTKNKMELVTIKGEVKAGAKVR